MPSLSNFSFSAGVTFRRYGMNGELKRPMIHRFPASKIKCETSVSAIVCDLMSKTNDILGDMPWVDNQHDR